MSRRLFLALSPAMLGLLPMPGGALLSAPLVERGGPAVNGDVKAAVNVWFRHGFVLIYPLGALLATSKAAGVDVYVGIMYLFPAFILMILFGWFTMLRGIDGRLEGNNNGQGGGRDGAVWKTIIVLLSAPFIHFSLMLAFPKLLAETALVIAVMCALLLSLGWSGLSNKEIKGVIFRSRFWKFGLIVVGMFLFLEVFKQTAVPIEASLIPLPGPVLVMVGGFLLGFATGRVLLPAMVIIPIQQALQGGGVLNGPAFAIIYTALFLGYVISPVHPCALVSVEYFNTDLKSFWKTSAPAVGGMFTILFAVGLVLL